MEDEANQALPFGYRNWAASARCGATPEFAWAGIRTNAQCLVPRKEWPVWWRAALLLLEKLAETHPPLGDWLARARAVDTARARFDPLAAGWQALSAALGLPDYPMQARAGPEDAIVWHSACPYLGVAHLGLSLTQGWLVLACAGWKQGGLRIKADRLEKWRGDFDRLPAMLPDSDIMGLHRDLWRRGVAWRWEGGRRTRVGVGDRQAVIEGAGCPGQFDDPDEWRVPIYTVTGSVGKTTTVRMLSQLLANSGKRLALTASDGAWIGATQVAHGDCIGGLSAETLLNSPDVEAALFEQGRGGIIKHGVPYARSDVAVLINVQDVHLGLDGVDTLEDMARVKAMGVRPARVAVLNHEDAQCRRIGARRPADSCVWFSLTASPDRLRDVSAGALGAAGVERDENGEPLALAVWRAGRPECRLSLDGVAPYHGLLGEKTVEELLAVVAAAWFGPLPVSDWQACLRALRLDNTNHLFRTSVHRRGEVLYVLDKAGEESSLDVLREAIENLAEREGIARRVAVVARAAGEPPERHRESARLLHGFMDEFICFDRPVSYTYPTALPVYAPGSIPLLLRDEFARLNAERGTDKPVTVVEDWAAAEACLREYLSGLEGKVLVLINQPSTADVDLNDSIVAFVTDREAVPGD